MDKKDISKHKRGLPPGSVIFTGDKKVEKVLIHYLQYDEKAYNEKVLDNHSEMVLHQSPVDKVDWYDLRGLHDTVLIERLGVAFNIHPLILEDIADIRQRPKFDEYANGIFISFRALSFNKKKIKVEKEQVALYFKAGFVVTFQETESDLFLSVRDRIKRGKGKLRTHGADYLAYALVDSIVDNYYVLLEEIGDVIENLEDEFMLSQDLKQKSRIHALKKELLILRKSVAPLREAISRFSKTESAFVEESSLVFIRDLYDHTIQIMDSVESYRDMLNSLQDLFMSEVSFKMNQVMQLLTLVSTIFIPLTFLAGIYGMNFENMPELRGEHNYYILLFVMAVVFVILVFYFKKKKWI